MDTTSYIALSRQTALQRQLANISNNIANATSTGFRAEHMVFEAMLERSGEPNELAYVQDVAMVRDLREGPMIATGNRFDLALAGNGYFTIETPAGVAYTRAGQFQPDVNGQLVTPSGYPLLDDGGQPVTIPPGSGTVEIAEDGTMTSQFGIIGRIRPVSFENEQLLERAGDAALITDQAPLPSEDTVIKQGFLEGSNVQSVLELTRLMDTVRAFEGTQRLIETQHEMTRRVAERVLSSG